MSYIIIDPKTAAIEKFIVLVLLLENQIFTFSSTKVSIISLNRSYFRSIWINECVFLIA